MRLSKLCPIRQRSSWTSPQSDTRTLSPHLNTFISCKLSCSNFCRALNFSARARSSSPCQSSVRVTGAKKSSTLISLTLASAGCFIAGRIFSRVMAMGGPVIVLMGSSDSLGYSKPCTASSSRVLSADTGGAALAGGLAAGVAVVVSVNGSGFVFLCFIKHLHESRKHSGVFYFMAMDSLARCGGCRKRGNQARRGRVVYLPCTSR